MQVSRPLVSTSLLIALLTAYFLPVPPLLIYLIAISGSFYDFNSLGRQQQHPHRKLLMICLAIYASEGSFLLADIYCHDKNIWFAQVLVVSVSDICQYLVGKHYGKTHISAISPGKTLEGYLGSLLIVPFFLPFISFFTLLQWISLGIIGDLYVSWCKRSIGVKDTSNLLGPHGGWLDRVDGIYMSLIVTNSLQYIC